MSLLDLDQKLSNDQLEKVVGGKSIEIWRNANDCGGHCLCVSICSGTVDITQDAQGSHASDGKGDAKCEVVTKD